MYDPTKTWLRLQQLAASNVLAWMQFWERCWRAGMKQNRCLVEMCPHRREADVTKPNPCSAKSPHLAHHYGRRHHDVDVEKI